MAVSINTGWVELEGEFFPVISWQIEDNPRRWMKCQDAYPDEHGALERAEALAKVYMRIAASLGYEDFHEVAVN